VALNALRSLGLLDLCIGLSVLRRTHPSFCSQGSTDLKSTLATFKADIYRIEIVIEKKKICQPKKCPTRILEDRFKPYPFPLCYQGSTDLKSTLATFKADIYRIEMVKTIEKNSKQFLLLDLCIE